MKRKTAWWRPGAAVAVGWLLSATVLQGQGFVTNGSAAFLSGNCYQLTPDVGGQAGSLFSSNAINLAQPFMLDASVNFGCKDVNGADGIVFIFATTNTALGAGGGFIGYQGITPSIAIEYDDYQNGGEGDPVEDHMAIISMGSVNHNASTNLVGPVALPNIEDCADHCLSVLWDPVTQTLTATLDSWVISYTGDIVNDIFGGNPNVYYGFSSGTGALSNLHIVCPGPPVLVPMEDATICEGNSMMLQADLNGSAWTWAPHPTLSPLNVSNPTATPTQTTTYTVTIDYPCGGMAFDTVVVTVIPIPTAMASNTGPVCPGEMLGLFASGGTTYAWSGPMNFSSTSQNPVIANVQTGMTGLYVVTVTDAFGCTGVVSTLVLVHPETEVEINPVPLPVCEGGDPVQFTASPPGGIWSGEISSTGVFNPISAGPGLHIISYNYIDGNGCSTTVEETVEVVPNTPALIFPDGPFCVSEQTVTLSATPAGGEWGEAADPNGQIHPAMLGVGTHLVTYVLSAQNGCFNTELFIEVLDAPAVNLVAIDPLCPNLPVQTLTGTPLGGTWGGVANAMGEIDPGALLPGTYQATYTLSLGNCADSDTVSITILPGAPEVGNFTIQCDSSGATYVVHFTITGGDPLSYFITGSVNGSVIPGTPYVYSSMPIPSGSTYMFSVDDMNSCDPTILSGSHSCVCMTNAGTMDLTPIIVCEGEDIVVMPPVGVVLDANDTLVYFLHAGDPDSVLLVSATNVFPFGPPLEAGVTYFISAAVGSILPGGGIDLMDTCLSVAFGTPVMWFPNPSGNISAPEMICTGDSAALVFHLTGTGPYAIVWNDGTQWFSADSVFSGHSVTVVPTQTTSYTLLVIIDRAMASCTTLTDTSITISVVESLGVQQSITICAGDSVFAGGAYQYSPGLYIDTLTASAGCDSIVQTQLMIHPESTTSVMTTTCDSDQAGVFTQHYPDLNGCDSTVVTTVVYVPADTTFFIAQTCDPAIADTVTQVYLSQVGCDSVVIVMTALLPHDSTYMFSTTCDSDEAGVMTSVLQNRFGCDSIIVEQVSLTPADTSYVDETTCDPAEAGVSASLFTNSGGCDSLVITTVSLSPSWVVEEYAQTCDSAVAGVFEYLLFTADGCDSLVREVITLLPAQVQFIMASTCAESDTGTAVQNLINTFGCDSIVYVQTNLLPYDSCREIQRDVFVPNVFSPDGDGVNDWFFIQGDPFSVAGISALRIFDRWGGLVFESQNVQLNTPASGWDGTHRGKQLTPGVFVWVAEIAFADGGYEMRYGDVTLIR